MKPRIIIIYGPMGAGKSTISASLMEKLGGFYFLDRAYIKNTMLKKLEDRQMASRLSKEAIYLILEELLKMKKDLLLQEFRPEQIAKRFGKQLKKGKYQVIPIFLECSVDVGKKRDMKRQSKRRPELVEKMHKLHGKPDKGDIVINTEKNSIAQTTKKIISMI